MDNILKLRLEKLFDCKGIDKFVIANASTQDPNFRYLTRFRSGIFEDDILIVERNKVKLITSELEYATAVSQRLIGMQVSKVDKRNQKEVKEALKKELQGKRIGINGAFMPAGTYLKLRREYKPAHILDASECFAKARLVKDKEEIASIDQAARITGKAMQRIGRYFKEGITELELARIFDRLSEELGSEKPSFDTIVCFGKNAALPHHMPDGTRLRNGDIVLIDAGATANGYCSDMTRTFIFGKDKRIKQESEMMQIVKEAQRRAISEMKPGATGSDVDKAARSYIDSALGGKYKGTFIHSLGHSVGLEVHDGYGLYPGSKTVLKEGMIFTAEPGVYVVGFGGVRIEDDVLITRHGNVLLGKGELG